MDALLATLRSEFEAEQGSFLLQLRCDLCWDPGAFARATRAMYAYVQQGPFETIPRWIADGFWYMDWFVRDWSAHTNFPRQYPPRTAWTRFSSSTSSRTGCFLVRARRAPTCNYQNYDPSCSTATALATRRATANQRVIVTWPDGEKENLVRRRVARLVAATTVDDLTTPELLGLFRLLLRCENSASYPTGPRTNALRSRASHSKTLPSGRTPWRS